MRSIRTFTIVACLSFAAAAQPVLAGDPFRPGIKDQIELGKRASESIRKEQTVLPDTDPRVIELRRLGEALLGTIPEKEREKKPFEYSFDVIESDDINAFALPGGPIFFYTGLLNQLETEDQVAGILGHEIVHIHREHWASAYARQQKRQLGITAILLLLGANDTVFDLASVADTVIFTLPNSREHESDSDRFGFSMVEELGYNPLGMADVFRKLDESREASGRKSPEEWSSTHPDTTRRIENLEKMVKESGKDYPEQRPRQVPAKWVGQKPIVKKKDDGDGLLLAAFFPNLY